ncbi:hypothetical protein M7I_6162 [Glarea lozoyensis 74030]|uniref:Uncharacterized protein n=1 Tax=Glarea lozoyensis (strain ATCC 74030 / MF5533) TaxID=1104152 RepID=H0ETU2_GLAL7|nr:hypothetical protein M7I_6162 [Glarea lozoyensis 74030]
MNEGVGPTYFSVSISIPQFRAKRSKTAVVQKAILNLTKTSQQLSILSAQPTNIGSKPSALDCHNNIPAGLENV